MRAAELGAAAGVAGAAAAALAALPAALAAGSASVFLSGGLGSGPAVAAAGRAAGGRRELLRGRALSEVMVLVRRRSVVLRAAADTAVIQACMSLPSSV